MTELLMERVFVSKAQDDLDLIAEELITSLAQPCLVAFYGKMGAGKTTLIKAICKKLGVTDKVTSPTFAIINEYALNNGQPVYHFDFYRINKLSEAFDLGYEDFFYSQQYCFVEWPEKISTLLPPNCVEIHITVTNGQREIKLIA